ncbi:BadF/BadG/BcrA/BcrD ATPase family protein [Streptomyces sp. ICBB 8177]|uniref:N-acetylglucosamine kinase n=1 Tax=Streptomyces sp. ICBB 8177 TaxID=563922 RepID=UPI001F541449|nr:BadF/BadG/BcrA/BcrD ATPase family protein [Streptomyces sp. ICBB 8177]
MTPSRPPSAPSERPAVPGGVLAIDAGNSKTDVAIVAADGTVLGTARGGGFQPPVVGVAEAVAGLAPLVALAAHEAGIAVDAPPLVEQVCACLANADFPVEEQQLELALRAYGWGRRTHVANDTFAILRAGVAEPRGVAVVCGAGINCVGMLPDGRTARFPAVGRISGDWGGGAYLSEEALWWAARAEDGRGEPTALATALPAHFGLSSMYALIEALHLEVVPAAARHELVPVLFRVADGGDPVARRIVERQAQEITALARVALRRLDLLESDAVVVLGGGVLAARHPLLLDDVAARLAAVAPRAVARVVSAPPVLGAALLGMDRVGAGPAASARLREHFGADAPADAVDTAGC